MMLHAMNYIDSQCRPACDWLIFYGAQLSHIVSTNNTYECSYCDRDVAREKAFHQKDLINSYITNPVKSIY